MSSQVKTKINHGVQNHEKKTTTASYSGITSDRLLDMAESRRIFFFVFASLEEPEPEQFKTYSENSSGRSYYQMNERIFHKIN